MDHNKEQPARNLKRVLKGAAWFSMGDLLSRALQFILTITVIRTLAPEQYGLLSLGFTVVGMATLLAALGFPTGIPRFIARSRDDRSSRGVVHVTLGALAASIVSATFLCGLMWMSTQPIARSLNKPELYWVLGVLVLSIPANVAIRTLTAIFRGMEIARAKIWFEDFGTNAVKLALLAAIIGLGMGFSELVWIYVIGPWVVCIVYGGYVLKHFKGSWSALSGKDILNTGTKLMAFSLPLLGAALMANGISWTGSLTVGYVRPVEEVGFFNAALRLASLLPLPLTAMVFFYLPVAARASGNASSRVRKDLYRSTTKWSFFVTLPVIIYMLADAEFIVVSLFGDAYGEVANVLRAMVVGFAVHTVVGPNGMTLIALGDSRTSFVAAMLAVVSTVALCLILVPVAGVVGAGIGLGTGHAVSNVYISLVLFRQWGIHPFTRDYIFPLVVALLTSAAIVVLFKIMPWNSIWLHILLLAVLFMIAVLAPVVTKTLTKADLEVLAAFERKLTSRQLVTDRMIAQKQKHSPGAFI